MEEQKRIDGEAVKDKRRGGKTDEKQNNRLSGI
jgi:hypothetical protein